MKIEAGRLADVMSVADTLLLSFFFSCFRSVYTTLTQGEKEKKKKLLPYGKGSMSWNEGARRKRDGENVQFAFFFPLVAATFSNLGSSS